MNTIKKIVITGPESTGKTTLCMQLAKQYNSVYIPEYARFYVENLNRKYTYEDIEHIARKQVTLEKEFVSKANSYLFYDTYLIITKIWFVWCYEQYPKWVDEEIANGEIDLFLLLNTDIQWEKDLIRENNGENRQKLFELYKNELEKFHKNYIIINGIGQERFRNALNAINKLYT